MVKTCTKCGETKKMFEFSSDVSKKDNLYSSCKACVKKYNDSRKEQYAERWKTYYQKNKEQIQRVKNKARKTVRGRAVSCKQACRRTKKRRESEPAFKLKGLLRARMRNILKGQGLKVGSAVRDLGCSVVKFRQHLESLFQPGMSWGNHGVFGWHIDHIKPLASFDLTNREEFLVACNWKNMRPLWAKDNLSRRKP